MFEDEIQPGGIELAPGVRVPSTALRLQYSRSSGPGGQNVNKLNTKVELWLDLAAIESQLTYREMLRLEKIAGRKITRGRQLHLTSEAQRSQEQNRQQAMQKLREMLIEAMAEPKVRRKTKPSRGSKQRRLDQKKRRGQIKARRSGPDSDH